jgi:hypothetical protein
MVDPIIVVAAGTAGIGLWLLATGRTFRGLPRWPVAGARLRWAGAYDLLGSLLVIVLAVAVSDGVAFVTYAILSLGFVAVLLVAPRVKPGT